jgi:hypothetical protein
MSQRLKFFRFLLGVSIFTTACSAQTFLSQTEEKSVSKAAPYEEVLGKSMTDALVVDFIASKQCSSVLPYVLCKEAGMALMIGSDQQVEGVFLYVNKSAGFVPFEDDFTPYHGELPYGLKYYDTMGAVEHKLNRQGIGNDGHPESGSTPDHMHYVAFYEGVGITIIYNSPPDEDAMINAILVKK